MPIVIHTRFNDVNINIRECALLINALNSFNCPPNSDISEQKANMDLVVRSQSPLTIMFIRLYRGLEISFSRA